MTEQSPSESGPNIEASPAEGAHDARAETTPTPTPREERVAVLRGDRMCVDCGYNLTGQPVLREPEYGLFIVRCPECSAITSAQEYPLVGRWPGRFTTALALAWLFILVAALAGVVGPTIGLSIGFTLDSTGDYTRFLQQEFSKHVITKHPDADPATLWKLPERFDAWYESQDAGQLLTNAGGWLGAPELDETVGLIVPLFLSFVAGLLLSLAVIHRKRWSIAILVVSFATIALTVLTLIWMRLGENPPTAPDGASMLQLGLPMLAVVFILDCCMALIGVFAGRPIGRGAVRALLPPRFRTALSVLWVTDGLEVPDHDPNSTRWTRGSLSDQLQHAKDSTDA